YEWQLACVPIIDVVFRYQKTSAIIHSKTTLAEACHAAFCPSVESFFPCRPCPRPSAIIRRSVFCSSRRVGIQRRIQRRSRDSFIWKERTTHRRASGLPTIALGGESG